MDNGSKSYSVKKWKYLARNLHKWKLKKKKWSFECIQVLKSIYFSTDEIVVFYMKSNFYYVSKTICNLTDHMHD